MLPSVTFPSEIVGSVYETNKQGICHTGFLKNHMSNTEMTPEIIPQKSLGRDFGI